MRNARLLLERITEIAPPGKGMRHNLTIDENTDLVIHFMFDNKFVPVVIGEDELDTPISQLINKIKMVLITGITE
ncbi:MAG: hypothetical protein ACXACY_30675 [Candidatus Hodarchaeales archaeon]|jgi:hypothetical protein